MPAAQTDLPNLTNIVNPSVPARQAPTVNIHTGDIEPPSAPLPACNDQLDPRTGNMLRAQRGTDAHPGQAVTFPNPPSVITDRGALYQTTPI